MKNVSLKDLRYYLFPSADPPRHMTHLHERVFSLWSSVWEGTFKELKYDSSRLVEDFVRQDLVAAIFLGQEPVAVHLYSFFSLDATAARKHPYLRQYPEGFFRALSELGVHSVMSAEYLTIHPEWKKSRCDLHLGAVLVGLCLQVSRQFEQDAAIAPARKDHKVHELAYALGCEPVLTDVLNHNVLCDLVVGRTSMTKRHPSEKVQEAIHDLWERREIVLSAYAKGIQKAQAGQRSHLSLVAKKAA